MSISFTQKQQAVTQLAEHLSGARVAILADYRGLSVAQMTELRAQARAQGVRLRVVKNSLAKRALATMEGTESDGPGDGPGKGFAVLSEYFCGPVAMAWSVDAVATAKVLSDFAQDNDALHIKVGVMDGALLDAQAIKQLAALPGRQELLATVVATIKAPLNKLVGTLAATPVTAMRVLVAFKLHKEQQRAS